MSYAGCLSHTWAKNPRRSRWGSVARLCHMGRASGNRPLPAVMFTLALPAINLWLPAGPRAGIIALDPGEP